jgi:outer membrane protein assembly factor BamA
MFASPSATIGTVWAAAQGTIAAGTTGNTDPVAGVAANRSEAQVDTLYIPDLVKPEEEEPAGPRPGAKKEITLGEGPDIEIRFGETMKPFVLAKQKEHPEFAFGFSASFDRVDGLSLFLHQQFTKENTLYPTVHLMEGYAFDGRHWRYRVDFEQPLFRPQTFSIGASAYRLTDTYDGDISGIEENSLAALFLKHDYRDYFEREGALVFVKQRFLHNNSVTLQYAEDVFRSLEVRSKGLFYRHSREFRPNPAVDEGKWATVTGIYELDSRKDSEYEPGMYWYRIYYERGENKDAVDVDETEYARLAADLRSYLRMSPGQYLNVRLMAGSAVSGALPFQREFYAGGLGTLNAHTYKEFRGDQLLLANAEYLFDVVKRFQFILFLDAGKAWYDWDTLKDQRMELDVGIGIGSTEGFRLCVAKTPREEDSDPVWILRLQRPF